MAANKSVLILLLLGALMSGACYPYGYGYGVGVRVGFAPPPFRHEAVIVTPGPGYVWLPGYYDWRDSNYFWVEGRWEQPPRRGAIWVAPRYVRRHGTFYYHRGHWR
ncbi:MAG TPA: hypothetical protein VOA87_13815 [Thermoanaerobaculia bacterium]|nr:hypothetical protein [Thermoanaerobaculia bacterium]